MNLPRQPCRFNKHSRRELQKLKTTINRRFFYKLVDGQAKIECVIGDETSDLPNRYSREIQPPLLLHLQ